MQLTFSYSGSKKFDQAASEVRGFIGQGMSKCSNNLSIKYLVPKPLCEYVSKDIPVKTTERTLSYSSSENLDHVESEVVVLIA